MRARWNRRMRLAGVGAGLVAASLLAASPSGAQTSEWRRIQPPAGIRPLAMLNGVAAATATRAWAVGQEYQGSSATRIPGVPLVVQLDGDRWAKTTLRGITWKGTLTSVAATGASNAWAVGTDTGDVPHLLRFNGTTWAESAFPREGTVYSVRLVAAPGHAPWLYGLTSDYAPFLYRWTGSAWESVAPPPAPFSAEGVHVGVDGTVWLVGSRLEQTPGFPIPVPVLMVFRRSGSEWVALPDGPAMSGSEVLAGPGGDLWVAGAGPRGIGGPPGRPPSTALAHWDGTTWTPSAVNGTSWGIPTLSGDDAGRPEWATGTFAIVNGQPVGGYLKYSGGDWVRVPNAPVVAPEVNRPSISDLAHLPGTTSTLGVGWVPYPYEEQRVPRIEREDAP